MERQAVSEFFAEVVSRVIGPSMRSQGFSEQESSTGAVDYQRANATVTFSYYLEDLPAPFVSVTVGRRALDGSEQLVALWRSIPDSAPERAYTGWRFRNPAELERVLERMKRDVLPRYGRPLWEDDSLFARLLAEEEVEAEQEHRQIEDHVTLLAARRAFEAENYQAAVDRYVLLGPDHLSAADRRRLYQARAKLASSSRGRDADDR